MNRRRLLTLIKEEDMKPKLLIVGTNNDAVIYCDDTSVLYQALTPSSDAISNVEGLVRTQYIHDSYDVVWFFVAGNATITSINSKASQAIYGIYSINGFYSRFLGGTTVGGYALQVRYSEGNNERTANVSKNTTVYPYTGSIYDSSYWNLS